MDVLGQRTDLCGQDVGAKRPPDNDRQLRRSALRRLHRLSSGSLTGMACLQREPLPSEPPVRCVKQAPGYSFSQYAASALAKMSTTFDPFTQVRSLMETSMLGRV